MQNSRDSSVWRTLAVAFGDGLAFGVGVTLTRGAARVAAGRSAAPEVRNNGWSSAIEQHGARVAAPTTNAAQPSTAALPPAPPVANAAIQAIARQMAEAGACIDRRVSELETKLQQELDALDAQDHELAEGVEARIDALRNEMAAEMRSLRVQMTAVHKEFAETLARLMDEQISRTIATRMEVLEGELRATIQEEAARAGSQSREQEQQIAELRETLGSHERNVRDLMMTLGQSCLQAVEQIRPVTAPQSEAALLSDPVSDVEYGAAESPGVEGGDGAGVSNADLPGFAPPRPRKALWRVPMVSSFLAATGSLLLLHYL